jgi:hypothetical protein
MKSEAQFVDLKERIATCGAFDHDETTFILDAVNTCATPELVSPDAGEPGRIDGANTISLTHDFLRIIRRHYLAHKISRDRVLEVLNALAFAVESVLAATNNDEKAVEFFEQARTLNRAKGD